MYIIICTIYTTVQRKQTYTITIQNVYNYMYNIYNGTEKKTYTITIQNVYNYMYNIYNGTEKTNIYNNNTKCI